MNDSESFVNRMDGKDSFGGLIRNPESGMETRFPFDGDPVTDIGWLEQPHDVGSILSVEPFELRSETVQTLTFAIVVAHGATLERALDDARSRVMELRNASWP